MARFGKNKDKISGEGISLPVSSGRHDETRRRGKLKIFFGLGPGVGKTFSMLQTAQQDRERGVDVVVGNIEPGNYDETLALLKGLEIIPLKKRGEGEELDIDAIITRHPYLVVVDELAHSNAEGSRHAKRYQDVRELLHAGINVYTTLNVHNLESRCDVAGRLIGITITNTVPDEMFEITDDLELIDITSSAFLDRLAQGRVHLPAEAAGFGNEIFSRENVIAMREMALRLVAERVDKQFKSYVQQGLVKVSMKSGAHLLVLVDESVSSEYVLRRAKNLSYTINADIIALYTETGREFDKQQHEQLARNLELVNELGAKLTVVSSRDVVSSALEVARRENITHIVMAKPRRKPLFPYFDFGRSVVYRLSEGSEGIDIYVVNPEPETTEPKRKSNRARDGEPWYKQYVMVLALMILVTLACLPLAWVTDYHVSFIMFFAVLALAWSFITKEGPVIFASVLSASMWAFFFVPPFNTMKISNYQDLIAVVVFIAVAIGAGLLTLFVRQNERISRKREEKTATLFRLADRLATADTFEQIVAIAKEEVVRYFDTEIYFILQDGNGVITHEQIDTEPDGFDEAEFSTAQWSFAHLLKAGRYTDTLSSGQFTFYPMKGLNINLGVVAMRLRKIIDSETELFLARFMRHVASTMERLYYSMKVKNANILFESDKLYRSLFNSMSHEFRIPLASVMGSADTLLSDDHPKEIQTELLEAILTASTRLSRLVDNMLNISRLENNKIEARIAWMDVNDLFGNVFESLKDELAPFRAEAVVPESMPLVRLDFGLIEQSLYNLVDNSCKYAPAGSTIRLKAFYDNGYVMIQESDRGPGFAEEEIPLLFNKFYKPDNNREGGGLGLGLSIVKGFIEAHSGTISIRNRNNGGAEFTIKIPTEISYTDNLITPII